MVVFQIYVNKGQSRIKNDNKDSTEKKKIKDSEVFRIF